MIYINIWVLAAESLIDQIFLYTRVVLYYIYRRERIGLNYRVNTWVSIQRVGAIFEDSLQSIDSFSVFVCIIAEMHIVDQYNNKISFMWKKIGIKQERQKSPSQKAYQRVRPLDQKSISSKDSSLTRFKKLLTKNDHQAVFHKQLYTPKSRVSSIKGPLQNKYEDSGNYRRRITTQSEGVNMLRVQDRSKQLTSLQLNMKDILRDDKNTANLHQISKKASVDSMLNAEKNQAQVSKEFVKPLSKLEVSSIVSEQKIEHHQMELHSVREKLKVCQQANKIYRNQLINLRQNFSALQNYIRNELKKYQIFSGKFQEQIIQTLNVKKSLLKDKSKEPEQKENSAKEELLKRIELSLMKKQKSLMEKENSILEKQKTLDEKERSMKSEFQQTQQILKLKTELINLQNDKLKKQQQSFLLKEQQIEIRQKALAEKLSFVEDKQNRNEQWQNRNDRCRTDYVADIKHKKKTYESASKLLSTISEMKNNLEQISCYNKRFYNVLDSNKRHSAAQLMKK